MFDLISGGSRNPSLSRTMTPQLVSVAGHGVVTLLVLVLPLLYAADQLPKVPTMMAFLADVAPPPPPPAPPPAPAKVAAAKSQPVQPTGAFAAPIEAPSEIRPEPDGFVDTEGIEGGVEGGIAGGVLGGIAGGLVTLPPPPPPPLPPLQPKGPVRIGGNIHAPALITRVEPMYSQLAIRGNVGGVVILEATVRADGTVGDVQVLRSVKLLDQAAIDAVKQWRYSPLVLNGVPTPFVLSVTLTFSLRAA
jgi:protein TonB